MREAMEGMMGRRVEEQSGQDVYSLGVTPNLCYKLHWRKRHNTPPYHACLLSWGKQ